MDVTVLNNDKNTLELEINGSDISFANLLVEKLNSDKSVEFAAVKTDHPVLGNPKIIVKTKKKDPADVLGEKLEEIKEDLDKFRTQFKASFK